MTVVSTYTRGFIGPISYAEDLQYFVAEVVDDLDGDAAGGRAVEGAGGVAVQGVSQASRSISALRVVLSAL